MERRKYRRRAHAEETGASPLVMLVAIALAIGGGLLFNHLPNRPEPTPAAQNGPVIERVNSDGTTSRYTFKL